MATVPPADEHAAAFRAWLDALAAKRQEYRIAQQQERCVELPKMNADAFSQHINNRWAVALFLRDIWNRPPQE